MKGLLAPAAQEAPPVYGIALWNGDRWHRTIDATSFWSEATETVPTEDGVDWYVVGRFVEADGTPSLNIAKRRCYPQPAVFADGFESGGLGAWSRVLP